MAYLTDQERDTRMEQVRKLLRDQKLDLALVYYDEFNIGNGWYLTGWCPQFESGAVLVPRAGAPMILGGPESEPSPSWTAPSRKREIFPYSWFRTKNIPTPSSAIFRSCSPS